MENTIKGFKVDGQPRDFEAIWSASASTALKAGEIKGIYLNGKGNLEISNRYDSSIPHDQYTTNDGVGNGSKVNIVSRGGIQIKPGLTLQGKSAAIAFDNEFNTKSPNEVEIQICNGAKIGEENVYNGEVMGLKLNVAEMVIDTNKAYTGNVEGVDGYDPKEFKVRFRRDKWNKGVELGNTGPIYAKLQARAFDFRCYDHGGIALQVAGEDGHGKENKIKFESDRTSELGAAGAYCGEGGKGMEFGTFNNEHASLYCGDYRFKGDAIVYASRRNPVEMTDADKNVTLDPTLAEKYDYPTQADDFKDITDNASAATWNEIVGVARAWRLNGYTMGGGSSEGEGISQAQMEALTAAIDAAQNTANSASTAASNAQASIDAAAAKIECLSANTDGDFVITKPGSKMEFTSDKKVTVKSTGKAVAIAANGDNVEITSGNHIKLTATENVSVNADKIKLEAQTSDKTATVEAAEGLSLGATPYVKILQTKISSNAALTVSDPVITLAMQNNFNGTVYYDSASGKTHIPYELASYYTEPAFYDSENVLVTPAVIYDPKTMTSKTNAFIDELCTSAVSNGTYFIRSANDNSVWIVEAEDGAFKKVNSEPAKAANHGLLSSIPGYENVILEEPSYSAPAEFTSMAPGESVETVSINLGKLATLVAHADELIALLNQ